MASKIEIYNVERIINNLNNNNSKDTFVLENTINESKDKSFYELERLYKESIDHLTKNSYSYVQNSNLPDVKKFYYTNLEKNGDLTLKFYPKFLEEGNNYTLEKEISSLIYDVFKTNFKPLNSSSKEELSENFYFIFNNLPDIYCNKSYDAFDNIINELKFRNVDINNLSERSALYSINLDLENNKLEFYNILNKEPKIIGRNNTEMDKINVFEAKYVEKDIWVPYGEENKELDFMLTVLVGLNYHIKKYYNTLELIYNNYRIYERNGENKINYITSTSRYIVDMKGEKIKLD